MYRNATGNTIQVSPRNPHYFRYKGKDLLLITSAEMYGAVINKNFDYRRYMDTLHMYGLNYTRIYPGAFVESPAMCRDDDALNAGEHLIAPWARSNEPGYIGGGNKFDLSKWDLEYFKRLRDFLRYAEERDIIVEICFFNVQYTECLEYSPLYKDSNIQGIGDCDQVSFQYLDGDARLVEAQLAYIEKLIEETNSFDNIIYEFIDEPTLRGCNPLKIYNWISRLIDKAVETEGRLEKKHMLAQQLEIGVDFCADDRISLITTQYSVMTERQVGGMLALSNVYHYDKPIEINETAVFPFWYDSDIVAASRLESWEFMVGGGAAFNQLNGYFNVRNPEGKDSTNEKVLSGLRNLREFMESFDYASMRRNQYAIHRSSIASSINVISNDGKQYVLYMHHSQPNYNIPQVTSYTPYYGEYAPILTLNLYKYNYTVRFIEPETLRVIDTQRLVNPDGQVKLQCPQYTLDLAIILTAE